MPTYLYHYPVAQALLHLAPGMHVVPLIGFTAGFVLPLAYLSWELIERPALRLRKVFARSAPTQPIDADALRSLPSDSGSATAAVPAAAPPTALVPAIACDRLRMATSPRTAVRPSKALRRKLHRCCWMIQTLGRWPPSSPDRHR